MYMKKITKCPFSDPLSSAFCVFESAEKSCANSLIGNIAQEGQIIKNVSYTNLKA